MSKNIPEFECYSKSYSMNLSMKLCTLGDGGVGKSTFIERVATGKFNSNSKMTIGIDFQSIHIGLDTERGKICTDLAIWDLGGERQFRFILPSYRTGADGGLLFYDVTRPSSMKNLQEWIELWKKHTTPGIPLYLIGTKHDCLIPDLELMVQNTMYNLKKKLAVDKIFLTSSKTGEQIHEVIISIIKDILVYKNVKLPVQELNFQPLIEIMGE
jgi:small GTP-binding protein